MKTKRLLLALSCLLLMLGMAYSQPADPPPFDLDQEMQRLLNTQRTIAAWDGSLNITIGMIVNPDIREGWGITDEQQRQIEEIHRGMQIRSEFRETPEYLAIAAELEIHRQAYREQIIDRETLDRARLVYYEDSWTAQQIFLDNALDNLLTTEQKRKIKEFEIMMIASPIMNFGVSPHMFEALDLTDAQKEQVEAIKREFKPEFERRLEKLARGVTDPAADRAFAAQFQVKVFDVLTDEQWWRLQNLVDNPPEYVNVFLRKVQENIERQWRESEGEREVWQPGPNSWRPGDSIPGFYRLQRNPGTFPRPVNQQQRE